MRIGFGCVNLGSVSSGRSWRADVRLVEEAIDRGITVLDTADAYGSGASERIVGRAVRSRRDHVELATKGGYVFRARSRSEVTARKAAKVVRDRVRPSSPAATPASSGSGYHAQDFKPSAIRRALEASLRRLGTDHVDVYQFHGPPRTMPDLVAELSDLVSAGKVRRFGVGAESLTSAAAWSTVPGIDVVQLPVGVLDAEAVDIARDVGARGSDVWARGVFAGGVLAAADRDPATARDDPKWPLIDGLDHVARRHGIDIFELALGFVRAVPEISTILLGMSTRDHLERNLALAAAPELSSEVLADVWTTVGRGVDGADAS